MWGGGMPDYRDSVTRSIIVDQHELSVLSPVHVASGQIEMTGNPGLPLVRAHVRAAGRVVIPGSSLKGVTRSIVEAISPSCVRVTRARPDALPVAAQACVSKNKLCVACRMFGALGYLGRVRFTDAVLQDGYDVAIERLPALYRPRDREKVYFGPGGRVKGRKFYRHGRLARGDGPVEVCPVGAKLNLRVHFDNLTQGELGLLLLALGQGQPKLTLKLGGFKPMCCGSIDIGQPHIVLFGDARAAYADLDLPNAPASLDAYLAAAQTENLVVASALESLAAILALDRGRQCPSDNY